MWFYMNAPMMAKSIKRARGTKNIAVEIAEMIKAILLSCLLESSAFFIPIMAKTKPMIEQKG